MVLIPSATPLTKPALPSTLLTVAAVGFEELQETEFVIGYTEASENVPCAVTGTRAPTSIIAGPLSTASVLSVTPAGTVIVAEAFVSLLLMPLKGSSAEICAVPAASAPAKPCTPAVLLMRATLGSVEDQVTSA